MNKYPITKCYRFDNRTDEILSELVAEENKTRKKKITESEYVRELIRRAKQEKIGVPKSALIHMGRTMAGCGNNINQIVHNVNMEIFRYEDLLRLRQCMEDIATIRKQLRLLIGSLF